MRNLVFLVFALVTGLGGQEHVSAREPFSKSGKAVSFPELLFSFNTNLLTGTAFHGLTYDGPEFENAVRTMAPRGLRFPGGTIANNYLWKEDSFSDPRDDKTGWAGEQLRLFRKIGTPYDLAGFARTCRELDQEAIWVLNVYEETPESVVALAGEWERLGLKVERLELGNETYWDGRSFNDVWKYIALCKPLVAALRKARPELEIGACFGPIGGTGNYDEIWNKPLAKENWYDAIIYHEYHGGQGIELEKGERLRVKELMEPERFVDEPVRFFGNLLPGKPIWFTEWNLGMETLKDWQNTGAELHFIAAVFDRLIAHHEVIGIACYHGIYDSLFGPFCYDDKTSKIETNASWELFKLLGFASRGAVALRDLEFENPSLLGFATETVDGKSRYFLVNRSKVPMAVALKEAGLSAQTILAPPTQKFLRSTTLIEPLQVGKDHVTLPPFSITVVGPAELLVIPKEAPIAANLFPPRPHLTLWYEPYASVQPRFDTKGIYEVDLTPMKGKSLAVVKMDLELLKFVPGKEYDLKFQARHSLAGGIVLKFPEAGGKEGFHNLAQDFSVIRKRFLYDPKANGNEVIFVFPGELIAGGGKVAFRNFTISRKE